jgi:hypothetical protein
VVLRGTCDRGLVVFSFAAATDLAKAIVGLQRNSELLATHWPDSREEMIALTAAMVEQAIEATECEVYDDDWVRAIRDV